jgi:ATP-dependent DNA helicase RecG
MTAVHPILKQAPGQQLAFFALTDAQPIAETLVAFANAEGGTLVFGVEADGQPGAFFGAEDADEALRAALRLCRPPMAVQWLSSTETPSGLVTLLSVAKATQVHSLADGRVFVRRGAENALLQGEDFDLLAANRPTGDFELEAVSGATRADLDEDVVNDYLEKRQQRNPRHTILPKDKLLQQIGALTEEKIPTVSGILLFGKEPQLFMPQSRTLFVKFADTSPRGPGGVFGYGRREELIGPLPTIIDRAWRLIWEEMGKRSVVQGLQRVEQTEYPMSAVREALVNAVAHRDYRLTGRSIEIRMYTDRLEIVSPGGLPAHITLDNIVEEHYSRNPRIVNGLYQWGYIEELGLGVDRMIEDMMRAGHPPPRFEARSHLFSVVLNNVRENERAAAVALGGGEGTMNERQTKALEFLQQNPSITSSQYRELCPQVVTETLRLDLADLVGRGILLKIGDKRGTRYILK